MTNPQASQGLEMQRLREELERIALSPTAIPSLGQTQPDIGPGSPRSPVGDSHSPALV